mgnify:CR=1 FL=1
MFREKYPEAWIFHNGTSRSELKTLQFQQAQRNQESYKEYLGSALLITLCKGAVLKDSLGLYQHVLCGPSQILLNHTSKGETS